MANENDANYTPSIPDSEIDSSVTNSNESNSLGAYTGQGKFRFWCQKVLPLVYDDSLSYYELLCKVVTYLNNVITDVGTMESNIAEISSDFNALQGYVNTTKNMIIADFDGLQDYVNDTKDALLDAYNDLQGYVNNYFNNLDVQEEINNKLDEMAEDGTLVNLVLPYLSNYVTPDMHGAKGDGVTDDYQAIVDAIADANLTNRPLVFLEGKTYLTSQPIVIENVPKILNMTGTLLYEGSGTALTLGKSEETFGNCDIKINVKGLAGTNTGSLGVKIINANQCQICINNVELFETGVELLGDGGGFAYNNVTIGSIGRCKTLLKLNSKNSGWCNENKFFGGRFYVATSDSFLSESVGILFTSERNYNNNGNTFYAPSLEGLNTCVKIDYGTYNRIYNARTENATNPLVTSGTSSKNIMTSLYGRSDEGTTKHDDGNIYRSNWSEFRNWFTNVIFDSGNIDNMCASNATNVGMPKLLANWQGTVAPTLQASYAEISAKGCLTIKSGRNAGCLISCKNNKTFLVLPVTTGTYRWGFMLFDSNDDLIDMSVEANRPIITTSGSRNVTFEQTSGHFSGGVISGTNSNVEFIVTFPESCVKAFIGFAGYGDPFELHRMTVKAKETDVCYYGQNKDKPVLSAIPTNTGNIGDIVFSTTPSTGNIGWMYDGTQWIAIG